MSTDDEREWPISVDNRMRRIDPMTFVTTAIESMPDEMLAAFADAAPEPNPGTLALLGKDAATFRGYPVATVGGVPVMLSDITDHVEEPKR